MGGDYVSEDYQRVAGSYIVDAVLATPLDAMPSAAGLEQYWAAADADPVPPSPRSSGVSRLGTLGRLTWSSTWTLSEAPC